MFFPFNYYSFSLALGGFVALISGFLVYYHDSKKLENITWFLLNVSSAVWSFGYLFMISTDSYNAALLSNWILHQAAILIAFFYFFFVLALTQTQKLHRKFLILIFITGVILSVLSPTGIFIRDVIPKFIFSYAPDAGPLYKYFVLYFFIPTLYAFYILYKSIKVSTKDEVKKLKFVLGASLMGFIGGGSVFFLTFNVNIPPSPVILFSLYPILITYAILRFKLFDIKVLTTELLVSAIWIFLLLKIFLSQNVRDRVIDTSLLMLVVFFGILLIKSVIKEVKSREQIEKLAKDLQTANDELARVSQAKSDFLSIASHQLKTPLSIIKGYLSLITEGSFGRLTKKMKDPLQRIYISNERLISLVEDLLNLSRIEDGRMKYDMAKVNLVEVVTSVYEEFKDQAKQRSIKFTWKPSKTPVFSTIDKVKIRNVVFNLVDNAIKYTEQGSIAITLKTENGKALVEVTDTGIGIARDHLDRLFAKFTRLSDGNRNFVISGFGLGLYITKLIVKDHNGRIWADSPGLGKGSTFSLELPLS
jgi:signal transduction histidine kinase